MALTAAEQRDRWIRLFNRLSAAVQHHENDKSDLFVDEVDERLHQAHRRIVRSAAKGER